MLSPQRDPRSAGLAWVQTIPPCISPSLPVCLVKAADELWAQRNTMIKQKTLTSGTLPYVLQSTKPCPKPCTACRAGTICDVIYGLCPIAMLRGHMLAQTGPCHEGLAAIVACENMRLLIFECQGGTELNRLPERRLLRGANCLDEGTAKRFPSTGEGLPECNPNRQRGMEVPEASVRRDCA